MIEKITLSGDKVSGEEITMRRFTTFVAQIGLVGLVLGLRHSTSVRSRRLIRSLESKRESYVNGFCSRRPTEGALKFESESDAVV